MSTEVEISRNSEKSENLKVSRNDEVSTEAEASRNTEASANAEVSGDSGMSAEIGKHLKLLWLYFKVNLSASMEYRTSFLIQVFGMMLNNMTFVFFWWVLFANIGVIGEYGMKDVMFIWALAASSFGFMFVVFGNVSGITNIIINGELDTYLLQPKDVYINVLCSRTMVSAWGDFFYGLVLFIIVYGFDPLRLLLFMGFVVFGGLLLGSVIASAETLTFFLGNASSIRSLVMEFMISFSIYPESIFRNSVRWIFYSLLPVGFIVFVPLRIMKSFSFPSLILLFLVDAVYIALGYLLFRKGLKRYESGNLVTTKL